MLAAGGLGGLQRILGGVAHLAVAALEHQERDLAAQQVGALGRGLAARHQCERAAQRLAAVLAAAERPLRAGELAERGGRLARLGLAIELGDGLLEQLGAPLVVAVGAVRRGGADQHLGSGSAPPALPASGTRSHSSSARSSSAAASPWA